MDPKCLPLFPIPIAIYNFLDKNHKMDVSLLTDILTENQKDVKGKTRSNMGGWHSKSGLENDYGSFGELRVLQGLSCERLWANINESGDFNLGHHHGKAALSGVYYPVDYLTKSNECYFNYDPNAIIRPGTWDGEKGGSLYFQDPSYGLKNTLIKDPDTPSPYTFDAYYTYPVSGLLIFFPSYLIHTVTPFKENKKRVSISFVCGYGKT